MSDIQTRIRTKRADNGATDILVLVSHPMETGQRVDPVTKEKIPIHFIQKLTFILNDNIVAACDLSQGVSKDPVLGVRIKGAKPGDKVKVTWSDNKGLSGEGEALVSDN